MRHLLPNAGQLGGSTADGAGTDGAGYMIIRDKTETQR